MAQAARPFRQDRMRRYGGYRHYTSAGGQGSYYRYRKAREKYLARHPLCEDCKASERTRPAEEIHHIEKVSQGGRLLDFENFIALCIPCHAERTARGE